MEAPEMFSLDEQHHKGTPSPECNSTPGCSTPSNQQSLDIAVERRVIPLLEYSEDVCPVCLEEYTADDPGAPTVCGHHYHLQCIMQWAQRSRECPLCFKNLQLEDEDMNSLLPFGEYIPPQQRSVETASLETWELERLLIRLATAGQREHRSHRSSRQHGSSGGGSRHRRQGSRGEASAPQPIAAAGTSGGSSAAAGVMRWTMPGEATSSSGAAAGAADVGDVSRRSISAPGPSYPSSWPPTGMEASSSGAGDGDGDSLHDDGHVVSPRRSSGSLSLKSRLAALRLREKFEKTTKELKSLFSPGPGGGGSGRGGAAGPSSSQN